MAVLTVPFRAGVATVPRLHKVGAFAARKLAVAGARTLQDVLPSQPLAPSQAALNRWLRAGSFDAFAASARLHLTFMDQANLVVCLCRILRELEQGGCAPIAAEGLAVQLLGRCEGGLGSTSSPHTLTNLAWALARLDELYGPSLRSDADGSVSIMPRDLMKLVLRRVLDVGFDSFSGRDAALFLWAVGWLHRRDGQLMDPQERSSLLRAVASGVCLSLPEVSPRGLAMLLWALAALDGPGTDLQGSVAVSTPVPRALFRSIAEEAGQRAHGLSAREIANVAWSFATVQVTMPPWLVAELPRRAAQLRPQECANVLWALAVASQPVESVVSELPCSEPGFLAAWKPQEMANAAWALANGCRSLPRGKGQDGRRAALRSIRSAITDKVRKLSSLELAMVAHTLGGSDAAGEGLVAEVSARASALLAEGALAPDAVLQVADGLRAARAELPCDIAAAAVGLCTEAGELLRCLGSAASWPTALQALQGLGLTTLGAESTESFLQSQGLAAAVQGARQAWPEGPRESNSVLCLLRYHVLFSGTRAGEAAREHRMLVEPARLFTSGSELDTKGTGLLIPMVLRFSRDRDAEFLALTAVIAQARGAATDTGVETWDLRGTLQLHVSRTPCLSCVGAIIQFRRAFPSVKLDVSFDREDSDG